MDSMTHYRIVRLGAALCFSLLVECFLYPRVAPAASLSPNLDVLFSPWASASSPGCVVGVQRSDQAPIVRTYGMADLEHGLPLSQESPIAVGSVAKIVTSLVIGTLIQEGKLTLDADIRSFVPELAHYPLPITVRELLTHTSGVRDFRQLLAMSSWRPQDEVLDSDVSQMIARQRQTSFVPGSEALYSNSDFYVLAKLAAHIVGQPFAKLAHDRVFTPLGMKQTTFVEAPGQLVEGRALGYSAADPGWRHFEREDTIDGPGALYTTVPDLLRLLSNFRTREVGGSAYVDAMQRTGTLSNGTAIDDTGIGYGLGTEITGVGNARSIGHEGTVPGFQSDVLWTPGHALALAIACNNDSANAPNLMKQLSHMYLEAGLPEASPAVAVQEGGNLIPAVPGTYQQSSNRIVYRVSQDSAGARLGSHRLRRQSDGAYAVEDAAGFLVGFRTTARGEQELLVWYPGADRPEVYDLRRPGEAEYSLSRSQLQEYSGRWFSDELDFTWEFVVNRNRLALIAPKWAADPEFFAPRLKDVFVGESGSIVEFQRGMHGEIKGFTATDDRARGVAFRRSGTP
jgi:CubicO group peptidase (beta-lactamase class C family)